MSPLSAEMLGQSHMVGLGEHTTVGRQIDARKQTTNYS